MVSKSDQLSIQDIADALNVSKSTVSRVISGKGRIGAETRDRVLKYIEANHYRPNSIAKSFSENKTYNIGVVLPMDKHLLEIPFFQACLLGISQQVTQSDYDVVVITVEENDITNLRRIVENKKVDGIILTRLLVNDLQTAYLKSVGIPFIVIGAPEEEGLTFIDSDNRSACSAMTKMLLKQAPKGLGLLLGSKDHMVNQKRYLGFKDALLAHQRPLHEQDVRFDLTEKEDIDLAVADMISQGKDLIICGDDYICTRVISYLEHEKKRGTKQVKLASFYNSQILDSLHANISMVDFDILALGHEAGQAILALTSGEVVVSKLIGNYQIHLEAQHEA